MSQSLMINSIFPKIDKAIGTVLSCRCHLTPQISVKLDHENMSIGIILCSDKDNLEVEYAIQNTNQPLGVATYTIEEQLPSELAKFLPSSDEIKKIFDDKSQQLNTGRY